MATEDDTYDGRRPTYNQRGQVRGFRSRPGAPLANPTGNATMSGGGPTLQSNWDTMFRNTASNKFGAAGTNPLYTGRTGAPSASGIAGPAGSSGLASAFTGVPAQDTSLDDMLASAFTGEPVRTPALTDMARTGPDHASLWSAPRGGGASRRPAEGWSTPNRANNAAIFDRYKTKGRFGNYIPPGDNAIGSGRNYGWASAF